MDNNKEPQQKSNFWQEMLGNILGEFIIYAFLGLCLLLLSNIWFIYALISWGALLLIIPYIALLYYLFKKLIRNQQKAHSIKNDEAA